MSDINKGVSNTKIISFADDTRVYNNIKTVDDCNVLQSDLESVYNWADVNNMLFNASKFDYLSTTPKLWIKKEIIICNSDAGLIVGSKGAKIRQLEDDSNTRISIPTPKPGSPTKVIIEGIKQDTELATATINSILSTKRRTHTNPGETIKEIRVDEHLVGHVFGQRGDKIGRIIANTTTKINNDYHNNGDSTFIVKGKLPNVESAIRQIEKAMEDGKTAIRRANKRRESPSDRDTYNRSRRNQTDTSRQGRSRSPARRH